MDLNDYSMLATLLSLGFQIVTHNTWSIHYLQILVHYL